jgi:hypothetical protein
VAGVEFSRKNYLFSARLEEVARLAAAAIVSVKHFVLGAILEFAEILEEVEILNLLTANFMKGRIEGSLAIFCANELAREAGDVSLDLFQGWDEDITFVMTHVISGARAHNGIMV